ncbi:MAG: hypothetical protein P8N09_04785 [Planctomycetota bacterium]|nr:hypothetical protein [Planctomycetota bacterium]
MALGPRHLLGLAGLLALLSLGACRDNHTSSEVGAAYWEGVSPLVAINEGPTYHRLEGYDPRWMDLVREGVEMSRSYWGSYGPATVWVLGREEGTEIQPAAWTAFLDEYCAWRSEPTDMTSEDCLEHFGERYVEVTERGESEAYLSEVRDADTRLAELVFINVHNWFFEDDPLPDPILRGVHEYTHVFQQSIGPMPTWMMEGTAVFSEAWLPGLNGRGDPYERLMLSMASAQQIRDSDLTLADIEEIEIASDEAKDKARELAYDAGAWAMVFLVSKSPTQSVAGLRDQFFPLVRELGWEAALNQSSGLPSTQAFYEAFEAFMKQPPQEQRRLLESLKA